MWRPAASALALAIASHAVAAAEGGWVLDLDGFGPLKIGMSFEQARRVAGPGVRPTAPGLRANPLCDQIPLPGHAGVALMFVDGVLHRIDVFKPGIRTAGGLAPGDPVARVAHIYPEASAAPNAYDDREQYLTVGPIDARALRVETHEGRVDRFYAGDWAQVQYTEGCL